MRHSTRILGTLAAAAFAASCASTNVDQEKTALLALDKEWSDSTKNVDKFLTFLAPDATLYGPNMPKTTGTDAIKAAFGPMMSAPGVSIAWTAARADVAASGDIGVTTGTYNATMNNAAGISTTEIGKYVTVWKKASGQWRVSDDIFNPDAPTPPSSAEVMAAAGDLKWGDAPEALPRGSKLAVVSGDPSMPGPFTVRAQLPAGYRIAPHWHPTDEHVTVLSGTIALGMGDTFDQAKLKDLPAGGYAALPATMHHYLLSKTAATIQVHGTGPLAFTYVNPADDPSKK